MLSHPTNEAGEETNACNHTPCPRTNPFLLAGHFGTRAASWLCMRPVLPPPLLPSFAHAWEAQTGVPALLGIESINQHAVASITLLLLLPPARIHLSVYF